MTVDDGGPAFPSEQSQDETGQWNQTFEPGMSLRDWFAGMALQGLLASVAGVPAVNRATDNMAWAQNSYGLADSMLKARKTDSDAQPH